jgi:hypothetical protein
MSKPGLGKGLGDLMHGDQVAGKSRVVSAASTTTTTSSDVTFGRGLTTLVSAPGANADHDSFQKSKRPLLPAWFFFSADILLLGYVVAITFDAPRPFDPGFMIFCAVCVALGCLLACFGAVRAAEQIIAPEPPGPEKRKIRRHP